MTSKAMRRSGRIAKKINIVLMGTDANGTVFSEQTTTVVLSRHGAGIVSQNKPSPDESLFLRVPSEKKEAQVRLVGRMGGESGTYVYGVEFVDPALDFWGIEFPPSVDYPAEHEDGAHRIVLECVMCQSRAEMAGSEVEADVYAVNHNVLKYCEVCGTSSIWKRAQGPASAPNRLPLPAISKTPARPEPPLSQGPSMYVEERLELVSPAAAGIPELAVSVPKDSGFVSRPETNVGTRGGSFSASGKPQSIGTAAVAHPEMQLPTVHDGRTDNRRRDVRTRVNFRACIRNASGDEIAKCDNISKGGLSFRSGKDYAKGAAIEVAVPYTPGERAIFVHAHIRHVENLGSGLFRYGVAYIKSPFTK